MTARDMMLPIFSKTSKKSTLWGENLLANLFCSTLQVYIVKSFHCVTFFYKQGINKVLNKVYDLGTSQHHCDCIGQQLQLQQ